ncbi:MAG: NAD(P)-dependent oxidoreductase [Bacteroidota bacterium]
MKTLKIGLLREYKVPPDFRVAFLPEQLNNLLPTHPDVTFVVERSPYRCVADSEYEEAGFTLVDDLSDCDILFGIKEVPPAKLIPNKTYFFFSHTIKKQPHNKALLRAVLDKNVTLIDYECLTDDRGNRTVAFGHYAGIAGAYNGIRAYGLRTGLFNIRPAVELRHYSKLEKELHSVKLPNIKIAVTGTGRVGKGVKEVLRNMNIREVSPAEYLTENYNEPVFAMLASKDYYRLKNGRAWDTAYFHAHPSEAENIFLPFAHATDILMASAFWHPASPALFSVEDMLDQAFKITVIADITCDIQGSIPSTLRASTIPDPFYDFNPEDGQLYPAFSSERHVSVMAVDNLPCELPRDAGQDFGNQLSAQVMPRLFFGDLDGALARATIATNGHLTHGFEYLSDYAGVGVEV